MKETCFYKITKDGDFYINITKRDWKSLFVMNPSKDGWMHLPFIKEEGIGENGLKEIYSPFYKMVKK